MTIEFITIEEMRNMKSGDFKDDGTPVFLGDFLSEVVAFIYSVMIKDEKSLIFPLVFDLDVTSYNSSVVEKTAICSAITSRLISKFRKDKLCELTRRFISIAMETLAEKDIVTMEIILFIYAQLVCKIIKPDNYVVFDKEKKGGVSYGGEAFKTFNQCLAEAPKNGEAHDFCREPFSNTDSKMQ